MGKRVYNWAIIGPGNIAGYFADGLSVLENAALMAVCSHSKEKADQFAKVHKVPQVYLDQDQLLQNPDIDIVYIANLNPQHYPAAKAALLAGKHVLVEKPMTLNAQEAEELMALAHTKRLLFMEGMWTKFHPITRKVLEWVESGLIGKVYSLHGNFGFDGTTDPESRVINLAKGGGALLDIGVYLLAYADMIFNTEALALDYTCHKMPETNVDLGGNVTLLFPNHAFASVNMNILGKFNNSISIYGSEGRIEVGRFFHPDAARLYQKTKGQGEQDTLVAAFTYPDEGSGFEYEAAAFMEALDKGETDNPIHPQAASLRVMRWMDTLRTKIGLIFPQEKV